MKKTFYITTTLPYVNAKPHIGHAREFIQADVLSRIHKELGYEVFFNTGTDEHGAKIFEKAQEEKKDPQQYVDGQVENFKEFCRLLEIDYDRFIRTTDEDHVAAAQEFWRICDKNGFINKKIYKTKYCVGCELEKTESELVRGECPDHPGKLPEEREEENYFFKFSEFSEKLAKLYEDNPNFVKPKGRFNEIKVFVEKGLEDFSISRLKEKMSWGIEVPGDSDHVMYVWFDALVDYISTLGWPDNIEKFEKFWGTEKNRQAVQLCGKDNLRQQSAMWQAMLMSVGLPNSKRIYVNGFVISGGQKMSKSIGNVISPFDMVERYGVDSTRYLLLSAGSFGEDTDITWEKLDEKYNADLANGIGNLTSRIITLYQKIKYDFDFNKGKRDPFGDNEGLCGLIEEGNLEVELERVMKQVKILDKTLEEEKPWELIKSDEEGFRSSIEGLVRGLFYVATRLKPFVPQTSKEIKTALATKKIKPLFIRI